MCAACCNLITSLNTDTDLLYLFVGLIQGQHFDCPIDWPCVCFWHIVSFPCLCLSVCLTVYARWKVTLKLTGPPSHVNHWCFHGPVCQSVLNTHACHPILSSCLGLALGFLVDTVHLFCRCPSNASPVRTWLTGSSSDG